MLQAIPSAPLSASIQAKDRLFQRRLDLSGTVEESAFSVEHLREAIHSAALVTTPDTTEVPAERLRTALSRSYRVELLWDKMLKQEAEPGQRFIRHFVGRERFRQTLAEDCRAALTPLFRHRDTEDRFSLFAHYFAPMCFKHLGATKTSAIVTGYTAKLFECLASSYPPYEQWQQHHFVSRLDPAHFRKPEPSSPPVAPDAIALAYYLYFGWVEWLNQESSVERQTMAQMASLLDLITRATRERQGITFSAESLCVEICNREEWWQRELERSQIYPDVADYFLEKSRFRAALSLHLSFQLHRLQAPNRDWSFMWKKWVELYPADCLQPHSLKLRTLISSFTLQTPPGSSLQPQDVEECCMTWLKRIQACFQGEIGRTLVADWSP